MMSIPMLAARDMMREPIHVLCIVSMIAGVLAPLMLMMSIRVGVVDNVLGKLRSDPNSLRIDIVGNHSFGTEELELLRARPELAIVIPEERSISRQVDMRAPGARQYVDVTLVSTGPQEPLLPDDARIVYGEVAISASLASRFELAVGDVLEMRAVRGNPPDARITAELLVAHRLPRGWLQGLSVLAPAVFVSDLEAFFDGYAVPELGVSEGRDRADQTPRYESFRVYAASLHDVVAAETLVEEELEVIVRSKAAEIESLLTLFRNIELSLGVLVGCATIGLAAAMTALFWANVERKRMVLAINSLLGAPPLKLAMFPVAQSVFYSLLGAMVSIVLFALGATTLNLIFWDAFSGAGGISEGSTPLVPFDATILCGSVALTLSVALISSAAAARRAAATEPAIAIRAGG